MKKWICILGLLIFSLNALAQEKTPFFKNADTLNKKRIIGTGVTLPLVYGGAVTALGTVWYQNNMTPKFQFFNDCSHWLGMDKMGHMTSTYYLSMIGHSALKWSGVERKKAIGFGGLYGFVFVSTFEVLDGFSKDYGFSWCDIGANAIGSALYMGQEFLWNEQRIKLKWSYWPTEYAQYRPNLLGENWATRIFKDYNGQTYWLSANIHSFLPEDSKFPKWLNVAFGYSINEMLKSDSRYYEVQDGNQTLSFNAYSEFYLSLDIDLTKIKVKSHFLRALFKTISIIKIPFPAISFSKHGVKGYWFKF
ncbi:MAG: DUF2279 domain-containing protein [Crocinitomicaceae bacterium]